LIEASFWSKTGLFAIIQPKIVW